MLASALRRQSPCPAQTSQDGKAHPGARVEQSRQQPGVDLTEQELSEGRAGAEEKRRKDRQRGTSQHPLIIHPPTSVPVSAGSTKNIHSQ